MQLRKLEQREHTATRKLWEEVFEEDTKAFLDYYYFIKAKENEIYVIETDGAIRAMLQLNPYQLQVGRDAAASRYVIAVATQKEYRGRGYMGALLRESMRDMYRQKMPFTFLMPAAEAIYTPYDFRYIYRQDQGKVRGVRGRGDSKAQFSDASIFHAGELSEFFNQYFSEKYDVCAVRDEAYYQTKVFEQQSENGGIRMIKEDGELVGMFFYAKEDKYEILEPLCLPGHRGAFLEAVYDLTHDEETKVRVMACLPEDKQESSPLIMARILHLESLLKLMRVRDGEELDCAFAVLDPILTQNSRIWRLRGGSRREDSSPDGMQKAAEPGAGEQIEVRETEDSQGVLTVGALTELLFGSRTVEEIRADEDVMISKELACELEKLQPFDQIFLNEIV